MTEEEITPNDEQQELIDKHNGIFLIDAGAGTGKTYAITRRYARILEEQDVEPEDLLLLTFTNNAADEMKERIINYCSYDMRELREAPISTFHSLSKKIVNEHGFGIPQHLGIDDNITSSTKIIENEILEKQEFRNYVNQFIQRNPQYESFYKTLNDYSELLKLIKELASKGVVPEKNGWYRDTEEYLDGNFDEYWDMVREQNEPVGNKSSELRSNTSDVFDKCLPEDAPTNEEVRGQPYVDKKINEEYAEEAFQEDREELKQFIHDIYYEYLQYCLSRNYINFNLLLVFAYILLNEDNDVRENLKFEYTMIDEFQDTNEIQLKIAMLLSTGNITAVGDWKQSIYSFQYADVDNIKKFQERLEKSKEELNYDKERVSYTVDIDERIDLKQNYRSTQKILDFSEQSLTLTGKEDETIDEEQILEEIISLEANTSENTSIQSFKSEKEVEAVLQKIQKVVDNPEYEIEEGTPSYEDIAVLTRNRKFGIKLQRKANEYNIPVAYEGGVELFKTRPAILLLAWLRVLNYRESKKGWAVILEEAGYNMKEIKQIIDNEKYPEVNPPENTLSFLEELEEEKYISAVSRKVFQRYGIENGFSDKITEVLQSIFDASYKNTGELVKFIEESIEDGATYEVDNSQGNAATVQTIHSAKGLEYPIVFVADINQDRFPSNQGNSNRLIYDDIIGIRQKKIYRDGEQYCFDNWKAHLASKVIPGDYDEERRLMYVAMTRAEQHLFFSAQKDKESKFFKNLDLEPEEIEPELEEVTVQTQEAEELEIKEPEKKAAIKKSVHSIMDLDENAKGGKGAEYGTKVHDFAERYAKDQSIGPNEDIREDAEKVKEVIDSLDGKLRPEVKVKIPTMEEERKVIYRGVIDLLHITEDKVEIIDWKTALSRENHDEYLKQLEMYERAVKKVYDKEIEKRIIYTSSLETKTEKTVREAV